MELMIKKRNHLIYILLSSLAKKNPRQNTLHIWRLPQYMVDFEGSGAFAEFVMVGSRSRECSLISKGMLF